MTPSNDIVGGTAGSDVLPVGYVDVIDGAEGLGDTVYCWVGNDTIKGGAANDLFDRGANSDLNLIRIKKRAIDYHTPDRDLLVSP